MDDLDLAVVDVETTGVNPASDRVIEVAVVRVSRGRVVEEFSSLVDPERRLSHRIWSLTGITDEDLRGAPLFRQIKDDLLRLLEGSILVAHNSRFDYGFLRKEFEREKIGYSSRCLCTARLSRMLFPNSEGTALTPLSRGSVSAACIATVPSTMRRSCGTSWASSKGQ
ncbi:MAG: 3'-5' exonuclease [Syntrophorhabdales bacterium]